MGRHIVCLTFDFDAISGWIARGATGPSAISRGEFGPDTAVGRILALLGKHAVSATWYVPGHTLETFPDACRRVHDAGHEIGHHGWTHRSPQSVNRAEEAAELERGNEAIHRLTGRYARGYRSPAWDLSPHTVDLLITHGFLYDSSMMGDDYTPYHARRGDTAELRRPAAFGRPTGLVEMPVSWTLDDFPHFEYICAPNGLTGGLMPASGVLQNWLDEFAFLRSHLDWGVVNYTFHPFVIGRGHHLLALEALIATLKADGAVFLRVEDAAAEFLARAAGGAALTPA